MLKTLGDTEMDDFGGIDTIDIICTTPEKFDAMTRRHRSRGSLRFFNEVSSTADIMKMNTSLSLFNSPFRTQMVHMNLDVYRNVF